MNYETDYFTYATDEKGLPVSFRLKDGSELIKKDLSLGYHVKEKGKEKNIPLNFVSVSGRGAVFASGDGRYRLTAEIKASSHYVSFTHVDFCGEMPPGAELLYSLYAGEDVSLFAYDYACEAGRGAVSFKRYWDPHPGDSLGGFAIYYSDSADMQDDCILRIWGSERVPHPNVPDWGYGRAKLWMDEWSELFADQSVMYIHPENLDELPSFEKYLDMADAKYVYLFTDVWQKGFWQTIYENHQVAGIFGDQAELEAYSGSQIANGRRVQLHYLTGTIGFEDPRYGGKNIPDGELATWADGSAARKIGIGSDKVYFKPAKEWYQMPDGLETKNPAGKNPEPFLDAAPGMPKFIYYNYLQVGGEVMRIGGYKKLADGTWELSVHGRGYKNTARSDHAAGSGIYLIAMPWDSAYAPGPTSALFESIAANWAGVLNVCKIYAAIYDGYENLGVNGKWGCEKFASIIYQHLDHPVITVTSLGALPQSGYVEYQLNRGKALNSAQGGTGVYRVNFNLERISTTRPGELTAATWPLVASYNLGLAAAMGGREYSVMRPDPMFGVTIKEFEAHGKTGELLALCPLWKKISAKLDGKQRARILEGNQAQKGDTAWIAEETGGEYSITPIRMMTTAEHGENQMFKFYQEDGVHPPAVDTEMGRAGVFFNHHAAQEPSFVLRLAAGRGAVKNPSIKIGDKTLAVNYELELAESGSVYLEHVPGSRTASVYDCNWNMKAAPDVIAENGFGAQKGENTVVLGSENGSCAEVKLTMLTRGEAMTLKKT